MALHEVYIDKITNVVYHQRKVGNGGQYPKIVMGLQSLCFKIYSNPWQWELKNVLKYFGLRTINILQNNFKNCPRLLAIQF